MACTMVEPRSHSRAIRSAICWPWVVMMVTILLELLPYMILSITREVTTVVTKPYRTESTVPNTGQPSKITTRSISPVTAPTER